MSRNALVSVISASVEVRAEVLVCGPVVTQLVTQPLDDRCSIFYPLTLWHPELSSASMGPVVQSDGGVHPGVSSQGGRRDHDRQGGSRERGGPLE